MQCFFVSRETSSAGDDLGIGRIFRDAADARQTGALCGIIFTVCQNFTLAVPQEKANAATVGVTHFELGVGDGLGRGNRLVFHRRVGTRLDPLDGRKTVLQQMEDTRGGYNLPVASL